MHPNPLFRSDDRALHLALIDQVGFGMVFLTAPDGPRVSHTPLIAREDGTVRFHLSRGSGLAQPLSGPLAGATALLLVNGPDGYISPRWYADPDTVPTWDYVALEMEGPVRRIDEAELGRFLEELSARHETRLTHGTPWTMDKLSSAKRRRLLAGIFGFEMEVQAWRPTYKLSHNKSADERERIAAGLEAEGQRGIAQLIREWPA
ncbi:MAG TPA: FMN-binding negative transcriptional regulator [Novosphingobium sp.]|nr:FMN-binding negative transcriptional regulator [Novosphingobium sp.]